MNAQTKNAIAERAIGGTLIVQTEQEVLSIKNAMRRAASCAIKDTEYLDRQALEHIQQKYLSALKDGAEKQAVEKAFETVLADFVEEQEQ